MYRKHPFPVQDWYKMRVVMIFHTYLHIQTPKYLISSGNLKQHFYFFIIIFFIFLKRYRNVLHESELVEVIGGCWRLLKLPTEKSNIESLDVKVSMKNHDYPRLATYKCLKLSLSALLSKRQIKTGAYRTRCHMRMKWIGFRSSLNKYIGFREFTGIIWVKWDHFRIIYWYS